MQQDPEEKSEFQKKVVQDHWGKDPCGSNYSDKSRGDQDFFEQVEEHRYKSHPFILEKIRSFDIQGKRALEVGFGMGTDHINLARQGAVMHGVDITPQNRELLNKRLGYYDLVSELKTTDAESLPYEDNSFDFVYSLGVIHHIPDTQKVVDEIYRVLKPGGKCWIGVYNRHSLHFVWSIFLHDWILRGGFMKETLAQRLARVEYPSDNPDLLVKVYSKGQMRKMFKSFEVKGFDIFQMQPVDVAFFGRFLKPDFCQKLGRSLGWYVCIEAEKNV